MSKKSKQTLEHFYNDVLSGNQQKQFRKEVMASAFVKKAAFYNWLNRNTEPNKLAQQVIVDKLNALLPAKKMVMVDDIDFSKNVTSTPQTV